MAARRKQNDKSAETTTAVAEAVEPQVAEDEASAADKTGNAPSESEAGDTEGAVADVADKVVLVRMVRAGDVEPHEAEVHPDEVSNYQRGGWMVDYPITEE